MASEFNRKNPLGNGKNKNSFSRTDYSKMNGMGSSSERRFNADGKEKAKLFDRINLPSRKIVDQHIGGSVINADSIEMTEQKSQDYKNYSSSSSFSSSNSSNSSSSEKFPRPSRYSRRSSFQPARANPNSKSTMKITFLGGLNEIGKNMTLFEYEDDMFLLDCGMAFPDGDMLGVDLVIPDFTYVERNKEKIKGIVLTHGHEDHIGALPYLLKNMNFPIYGTALTLGLVSSKLKEHNLSSKAKLNVVKAGQTIKIGQFSVEFIHVNHSIPDSVGIAITTHAGTIVHTGDFKIDFTPTTGDRIDLSRFAELGKKGVLALMADSTNAERAGYTMTEQKVAHTFDMLFHEAENSRIIIATFASNIGRIQQILNCAEKYGRKVAFSGRSMVNNMAIAIELGYVDVPDGLIIDIDCLNQYPKEQIVLVTTGSQGEPMSALSRMAYSDHRKVEVGPDDYIIISANPIPGNEKMVSSVVNELMKHGCKVASESMYEVHVSGHACQEELKMIQALTNPKYFIPVHGEQKHLLTHAKLAVDMGMPRENVFIGDIGSVVELSKDRIRQLPSIPAGRVMVDGLGVGDVGSIVLRDRRHLGEDGLIAVVVALEHDTCHVVSGPDIVSRGFVYVRESEPLMDHAKAAVLRALARCNEERVRDWGVIKNAIKDELSKELYDTTRRSPMIIPILMDV